MWKEAAVDYYKALDQCLLRETEENHKKSRSVSTIP
jgi:hypothetical protein